MVGKNTKRFIVRRPVRREEDAPSWLEDNVHDKKFGGLDMRKMDVLNSAL